MKSEVMTSHREPCVITTVYFIERCARARAGGAAGGFRGPGIRGAVSGVRGLLWRVRVGQRGILVRLGLFVN